MSLRTSPYFTILVIGLLILGCLASEENPKRKVSGKLRRRAGIPPSYAVPMEPKVQYSQRDPLYHQRVQATRPVIPDKLQDHHISSTEQLDRIEHDVANNRYQVGSYYPPSYYTLPEPPEPIIEIIIKESNVTLPTTPPPPPRPTTKEPVHVFYVKYKKNPDPKGKHDQIIYDPPIPALVPHTSDVSVPDDSQHQPVEYNYSPPPSTTTLRTIIRPESETYHAGGSGIRVTFGTSEETELEQGSELKPRVVSPPDSQHSASGFQPNYQPVLNNNNFPQHQYQIGQQPPTQVFNSRHQSHLKPPGRHLGQLQESSFQSTRIAPPTDEQIRQYQQEKLYLYQQSLKQQNIAPTSAIAPIIQPQKFQNPTDKPQSQLQINFNNQRQLGQYQTIQKQQYDQYNQNNRFVSTPQPQQQKPTHYHNYQQGQLDKQNKPQYNTHQRLPSGSRTPDPTLHQKEFNGNYKTDSNQQVYRPPSIPGLDGAIKQEIQPGISVFEQTIVSHEDNKPPLRPDLHFNSEKSKEYYNTNYKDGEIVRSVAQSEEHQVTPDYRQVYSSLRDPPKRNKLPESDDPLQFYPVYSTTQPPTQNQDSSIPRISTTIQQTRPSTSFAVSSTTEVVKIDKKKETTKYDEVTEVPVEKQNKTAVKVNLAALPDEIPADLREQLLSSGILGNADIQILDYDKVGDIPIESLPPEALENFYSAAASNPVPSVVKPESEKNAKSLIPNNSEKGQKPVKSHLKKYGSQIETKTLKDSKYNRYLPLKVNGTEFSMVDSPQLKGRSIESVVVLAPVDYDFIREKDEGEERAGKSIQVEGVRFIAGESLKDLVKSPTKENYSRWLQQERNIPSQYQSVILLITRKEERESKSNAEIFMYDANTSSISKLRGELSQTFVQVAEANSANQDLEGIDSTN